MRMQLNNFSAWICINEVEQPQYAIEYSSDGTLATCWIASEAGKNFSVSWEDSVRSFDSSGRVYVDGQSGSGRIIHSKASKHRKATASRDGVRTSPTTKRMFMFSELELTDDDRYLHTATSPDLGNIKLEMHQCQIVGKSTNRGIQVGEPDKIHERSKKAIGHRTQFGPDVQCKIKPGTKTTLLRKVATFVFKYRPLAQLQANGIVPLDKCHKRVAPAGDIFDLTEDTGDDDEVEARRIKALKEELSSLERKRDKRRKRVKTEPKIEVKEEPRIGLGDVIDLT